MHPYLKNTLTGLLDDWTMMRRYGLVGIAITTLHISGFRKPPNSTDGSLDNDANVWVGRHCHYYSAYKRISETTEFH
jgi:hypothetical protein